jgi:hypothetical protein
VYLVTSTSNPNPDTGESGATPVTVDFCHVLIDDFWRDRQEKVEHQEHQLETLLANDGSKVLVPFKCYLLKVVSVGV